LKDPRAPSDKKNFERNFKNPLDTKHNLCYTKYIKGNDTLQTRKELTTMKKATFEAIKTALTNFGFDNEEVLAELDKEINKGAEQKAKNAEAYEAIHDIVMGALSAVPVTVAELWEAIEDEVPEGITKGKVQYALTHLWEGEIVKIEGKPNTYRKAV